MATASVPFVARSQHAPRRLPIASVAGRIVSVLGLALLMGCAAAPDRREPLPAALAADARISGVPGARYWGDEQPKELEAWLAQPEATLRERYGGVIGPQDVAIVMAQSG